MTKDRNCRLPIWDRPLKYPLTGDRILSSRETRKITGLSSTTMWRERKNKRFPEPVQLTANRKGYLESEVYDWLQGRIDAARTGR
jgi:predicted DNA-binding transcriptional regulator AlpA